MPTEPGAQDNTIALVASSPETLENLKTYLHGAGVSVHGTRDIEELPDLARKNTVACVLFPDDYRWESVAAALADVSAICPEQLLIVVTAHATRFETFVASARRSTRKSAQKQGPSRAEEESRVLIVPRPAWGWTILDVIRAHTDPERVWTTD